MSIRPKPSTVIYAKNVPQMARFYREVAAMTEVLQDQHHVVLEDEQYQLVIHGIPEQIAAQIHITAPPEVREDTAIKPCLPVHSIAQARLKAQELGGWVAPQSKEWEARDFRACNGHDPEGNVFQVREAL
jgi:hypothetical protein